MNAETDSKKSKIKAFTNDLNADMQHAARSVTARHSKFFRTIAFDNGAGVAEWREAQKNPINGSWSVRQCRQKIAVFLSLDGKVKHEEGIEKINILPDVSFYDALYACAAYEVGQGSLNADLNSVGDDRALLADKHYRSMASTEGIVFDKKNHMPLIVIDGVVLNEEYTLDIHADKILENSLGNLSLRQDSKAMSVNDIILEALPDNLPATITNSSALKQARDQQSLMTKFRTAVSKANSLDSLISKMHKGTAVNKIDDEEYVLLTVLGLLTAGLGTLGVYLWNIKAVHPQTYIRILNHSLDNTVKNLPNSEFKDTLDSFSKAARATYYLEKAAMKYKKHVSSKSSQSYLRSAEKCIQKAFNDTGAISNRSATDLQMALLKGDFPNILHFSRNLTAKLEDLNSQFKQLENNL